jgi:hypothetical protein
MFIILITIKIIIMQRKFEDAEEQCEKSHGEGWGLATITTPEEFRELDSYMTANKCRRAIKLNFIRIFA